MKGDFVSRLDDLNRFYGALKELGARTSGPRLLSHCDGRMTWPERGVYFFFEPGEASNSRVGQRVVRVGTHAQTCRGYIERNSIALLSNFGKAALDLPSQRWLGRDCPRNRVQRSGLWNQNHVEETYDPSFLGTLERLVPRMHL
jgi:hypothetical protein